MEPEGGFSETAQDAADTISSSRWLLRLVLLGVVWLAGPVVYGLGWCLRLITPGHKAERFWDQWAMGNFFSHSSVFWWWFFACSVASFIVFLATAHVDSNSEYKIHKRLPTRKATGVSTFVAVCGSVLLCILSLVQIVRVGLSNNTDLAGYLNRDTVIHVAQLNSATAPELSRLFEKLHQGDGTRCDLVGSSSQPACVRLGTFPSTGWVPRISSLNSAEFQLARSSVAGNNISLDDRTTTYLNAWHGHPARWSGVLDGKGNGTGMGGVAEWDGTSMTSCSFTGKWAINRSFGGSGLSDLPDLLKQKYPALHWSIYDVWGYCDGLEPVVVVPMLRQMYYGNRTVDTAAGIVTIRGDHGNADLAYHANVKPGQYPGPVYPASLVDSQLDAVSWMAGRRSHDSFGFGFAPVNSAVQAGNVSDYLLQDKITGRIQWVTPITFANSTSNVFVGVAVSEADHVADGSLNQLSIYLYPPGDSRRINIDKVEATTRNWFAQVEAGFITSGGRLLEFTPLGGNMWRAYGEMSGVVTWLLDVDATGKTPPHLINLQAPDTSGIPNASKLNCAHPTSPSQMATCIASWGAQLRQSLPGGGNSGTGAGGVTPAPSK